MSEEPEQGQEIGVRLYNCEYFKELLPVKLSEIPGGAPAPWFVIKPFIAPIADKIYEQGFCIGWLLDQQNRGACFQAFMAGNNIQIGLGCSAKADGHLKFHASTELTKALDWFHLCNQEKAQQVLEPHLTDSSREIVKAILQKFYADAIVFVEMSITNKAKIEAYYKAHDEDRIDIPVRLNPGPVHVTS